MKGEMRIKIDGEVMIVDKVYGGDYLPMIECDGMEFYLAEDSESAGQAARKRWEEMAESDPSEFRCIVGDDTLVKWALGQYAGPGYNQVRSLEEWLDLWLDTPEEEFASYDSDERQVQRVGNLRIELGFTPTVAYRCN
jgi:hypothetical protein